MFAYDFDDFRRISKGGKALGSDLCVVISEEQFVADNWDSRARKSSLPVRSKSPEQQVPGSAGDRNPGAREPGLAKVVQQSTHRHVTREAALDAQPVDLEQMTLVMRAERAKHASEAGVRYQVGRYRRGSSKAKREGDLAEAVKHWLGVRSD